MINHESNMAKEIREIAGQAWGGNLLSSFTNSYVTLRKHGGRKQRSTCSKGAYLTVTNNKKYIL